MFLAIPSGSAFPQDLLVVVFQVGNTHVAASAKYRCSYPLLPGCFIKDSNAIIHTGVPFSRPAAARAVSFDNKHKADNGKKN